MISRENSFVQLITQGSHLARFPPADTKPIKQIRKQLFVGLCLTLLDLGQIGYRTNSMAERFLTPITLKPQQAQQRSSKALIFHSLPSFCHIIT